MSENHPPVTRDKIPEPITQQSIEVPEASLPSDAPVATVDEDPVSGPRGHWVGHAIDAVIAGIET